MLRVLAKAPAERHASAQELMWDARRVLQDLAGQVPGAAPAAAPAAAREDAPAGRVPIAVLARPTPPAVVALPEPPAPLAGVLGFAHRPFGQVDPLAPPYRDEPLASVRGRLEALLADAAAPVILLTAPRGAGATTLLRRVAAEARQARLVLALDVRTGHEGRTVTQRLSALAGVPEGGPEATEGLLVWLAEERRQRRQAPLVVLDGVDLPHPSTAGLAALVAGALATRAATLVLGGGTGLAAALATAVDFRDHPPAEVALPPLDAAQVARYLRAWLAATRPARAAPLLLSPDAQLVLTRRSEGVLARVNALAENMLVLAASRGERTLTSWHALAVPEQERWADAPPPAFPSRPAAWPTPAAAAVLDAARRAAGLPPAPRPPAPPPGGSP